MQFVAEQPSQLQLGIPPLQRNRGNQKECMYHAREPRSHMILTGGISCAPSLQELAVFFLEIHCFCCAYGFSAISPFFKATYNSVRFIAKMPKRQKDEKFQR